MITYENCGHQHYGVVYQKQLEYWHQIVQKKRGEVILFCSHPPIVTLGKKSQEEDLCGWTGQTAHIERGGKATYHGPGQIIVYPLLDLSTRDYNVGGLIRGLERSVQQTLLHYGLISLELSEKNPTGVWIRHQQVDRKIASIGIAVKRWVSFHGLAFNLDFDAQAFLGINPCGFSQDVMISLEEVLGYKISRVEFIEILTTHLNMEFNK